MNNVTDAVTLSAANATFANKNVLLDSNGVAISKVVTTAYTLSGADAVNYEVVQPNNLSAVISAANLTISTSNVTKTYDGTSTAAGTAVAAGGTQLFTGDTLTGGNFAFTNINAGTANKTVTVGGVTVNDGNSGANYVVTYADNTTSTINKANLVLTTSNVVKTYDAGTTATGSAIVYANSGTQLFNGDSLSGGTFAFTNANAGTGNKTVTVTGVTVSDGNSGGNYNVTYTDNTTSTINKATLTISGVTANNKTYDTYDTATLSGTAVLTGVLGSDASRLTLGTGSVTATFANANAGYGKAVTVAGYTLTGLASGNYILTQPSTLSADIAKATVTVSGLTANNKTYDGTTSATLSGTATVTGLGSDVLTVLGTGVASFADKNVAVNGSGTAIAKAVSVTGYSLASGGANDNYDIVQPTGLTAIINKATLSVTGVTSTDRSYDGTTVAALSGTAGTTALLSDNVVVNTGAMVGAYADKNVALDSNGNAIAKTVTVTGFTFSGADAGNYVLPTSLTTSSTITKAVISTVAGITASDKQYDGSYTATLDSTNASFVGKFGSDVLTVTAATGNFTNKNVTGAQDNVLITGIALGGADAGNYTLGNTAAATAATITAKTLTAALTNQTKVYDGTADAVLTNASYVIGGFVTGEGASITQTLGSYNSANVLNATSVSAALVAADFTANSGTLLSNYALPTVAATVSGGASITAKSLTATLGAQTKTYDGSSAASIGSGAVTLSGFITGESATVGALSGNYGYVSGSFSNSANVLDVTTVRAALSSSDVTAASGTLLSNYALPVAVSAAGSVTAKTLTATAVTANDKAYDRTTAATISSAVLSGLVTINNVVDNVTASGTGSFSDWNVAVNGSNTVIGKTVTANSLTLAGSAASNYVLAPLGSLTTTAKITQAALTISATAANKVYDGTLSAVATAVVSGGTLYDFGRHLRVYQCRCGHQ